MCGCSINQKKSERPLGKEKRAEKKRKKKPPVPRRHRGKRVKAGGAIPKRRPLGKNVKRILRGIKENGTGTRHAYEKALKGLGLGEGATKKKETRGGTPSTQNRWSTGPPHKPKDKRKRGS